MTPTPGLLQVLFIYLVLFLIPATFVAIIVYVLIFKKCNELGLIYIFIAGFAALLIQYNALFVYHNVVLVFITWFTYLISSIWCIVKTKRNIH